MNLSRLTIRARITGGSLLITIPSALSLTELDGGLLRAFLDEYFESCEGPEVVTSDPSYLGLRDSVPDRLPLTGLDRLDLARPGPSA